MGRADRGALTDLLMELAFGENAQHALSPCPERVVVQRPGSGSAMFSRCWAELRGTAGHCHPIPGVNRRSLAGRGRRRGECSRRKESTGKATCWWERAEIGLLHRTLDSSVERGGRNHGFKKMSQKDIPSIH